MGYPALCGPFKNFVSVTVKIVHIKVRVAVD
jgi:hypothetical protein